MKPTATWVGELCKGQPQKISSWYRPEAERTDDQRVRPCRDLANSIARLVVNSSGETDPFGQAATVCMILTAGSKMLAWSVLFLCFEAWASRWWRRVAEATWKKKRSVDGGCRVTDVGVGTRDELGFESTGLKCWCGGVFGRRTARGSFDVEGGAFSAQNACCRVLASRGCERARWQKKSAVGGRRFEVEVGWVQPRGMRESG